jgi:superkiller protein 3
MRKRLIILAVISVILTGSRGNAQLSTAQYDSIMESKRAGAVSSFNKALSLENAGEKLQAIEAYKQAIGVNPKLKEAYNNLAALYADMGMFDKALINYEKVLSLDENYALAYYNLGMTFYALGRYDDAIKAFEKGGQLAPNDKDYLYFLGRAYSHVGEYAKAVTCFERVVEFDPGFYPGHFDLASVYMITNKFNQALEHFNMVLLLAPHHEQAERIRAIIKNIEKLDLERVELRSGS